MQKYILYLLPLLLTGCGVIKTKYQTPYLIPNVSLQGDHWLSGSVIQSSKKRYWLTYEKALRAEGFQLADSYEKKGNQQNLKVPGAFLTYELDQNKEFPLDQRQKVNKKLFNEGVIFTLYLSVQDISNKLTILNLKDLLLEKRLIFPEVCWQQH